MSSPSHGRLGSAAQTLAAQNRWTRPRWVTRSPNDQSGQDGTRTWADTLLASSAIRALSSAMAVSCSFISSKLPAERVGPNRFERSDRCRHSTVDGNGLAGQEGGVLAQQESGDPPDLLGLPQPAERRRGREPLPRPGPVQRRGDHRRLDVAGADAVDPDPFRPEPRGQRAVEAEDARLRRAVGRVRHVAHEPVDRRDSDDRGAGAGPQVGKERLHESRGTR